MAVTAADVPHIYDLVLGQSGGTQHGYVFANTIDQNLPFRVQRAKYSYTPTFLPRQNVGADFGDEQQDFWLTVSQKDWSLGEGQKFLEPGDDRARAYWLGTHVDSSIPGQVSIGFPTANVSSGQATLGAGADPARGVVFTSGSTHLYEIDTTLTLTDRGDPGCGGDGIILAYAQDECFLYVSGYGCTKTRKYDLISHAFSNFSASPMADLLYLNNTLYGVKDNVFYTFDNVGTATASFTWRAAAAVGSLPLADNTRLAAYGGKILALRMNGAEGSELWQWDGTGMSILAQYPPNFTAADICVVGGVVFVIGIFNKLGSGKTVQIWWFNNGTSNVLFTNPTFATNPSNTGLSISPFGSGFVFTDFVNIDPGPVNETLRHYDLDTGAISTVSSYLGGTSVRMSTSGNMILISNGTTNTNIWPALSLAVGTYSSVTSSLLDFNSSLTKLFRGVIVDFDAATTGNGGTVDIEYQVESNTGTWTSLQTGITSGTEYTFPIATTGRSIAIRVTLNKGTSTLGPVLKRVYVRAAPKLRQFRTGEYILNCTGVDGKSPVALRNGNDSPLDGRAMVNNLVTDATSGALLTVTDRIGTYTGLIELDTLEILEVAPDEFLVRFVARGV